MRERARTNFTYEKSIFVNASRFSGRRLWRCSAFEATPQIKEEKRKDVATHWKHDFWLGILWDLERGIIYRKKRFGTCNAGLKIWHESHCKNTVQARGDAQQMSQRRGNPKQSRTSQTRRILSYRDLRSVIRIGYITSRIFSLIRVRLSENNEDIITTLYSFNARSSGCIWPYQMWMEHIGIWSCVVFASALYACKPDLSCAC